MSSFKKIKSFFKENPTKSENPSFINIERLDFDTLFSKFSKYVFGLIESKLDQEAAEDISPKVFIKIYRCLSEFNPRTEYSYKAWIDKIILSKTKDYIRTSKFKKAKKTVPLDESKHYSYEVDSIDIENFIANIPNQEIREIAMSLYYEGKTTEEIAKDRSCSPGTLRYKLYTHRKRVNKDLLYG